MPTAKQTAADRMNSQKSTGPRTTEGKAASRCNASSTFERTCHRALKELQHLKVGQALSPANVPANPCPLPENAEPAAPSPQPQQSTPTSASSGSFRRNPNA